MAEPMFDPLVAELRNVIEQADPIPESVLAAARASFGWRSIDAELAELITDSLLTASSVRSGSAARLLTFEGPGLEVEVEVADIGATRRLTGQLVPVSSATVVVRWNGGSVEIGADELGRFSVADVPAGSVSLTITGLVDGTQRSIVTSWVTI